MNDYRGDCEKFTLALPLRRWRGFGVSYWRQALKSVHNPDGNLEVFQDLETDNLPAARSCQ